MYVEEILKPFCFTASTLHGCTIGDEAVIGMNALVFGKVESQAQVASGSLVLENQTVKSGQLWSGVPAKFERNLSSEEIASFAALASKNVELAQKHKAEHDRSESERQHLRDLAEFNRDSRSNEYKEIPF